MRRFVYLPLIVLISSLLVSAALKSPAFQPIHRLFSNDSVSCVGASLGGYQGRCVELSLTNYLGDSLLVSVAPGTILVCDDSSMQDILVVKEELLAFAGREDKKVTPKGYCCRAHRRAPNKDVLFSSLKRGNDSLVKLAEFLNANDFGRSAEQNAIWAVSDGNAIAAIPVGMANENMPLRKFVSRLLNQPLPWFSIEYYQDSLPFSNRVFRVSGEFSYQVTSNCLVDIIITDESGKHIKPIKMGAPTPPGRYNVWVDEKDLFEAGKIYYVKVLYDRAEKMKREIKL